MESKTEDNKKILKSKNRLKQKDPVQIQVRDASPEREKSAVERICENKCFKPGVKK